jgi:hypothetical protein
LAEFVHGDGFLIRTDRDNRAALLAICAVACTGDNAFATYVALHILKVTAYLMFFGVKIVATIERAVMSARIALNDVLLVLLGELGFGNTTRHFFSTYLLVFPGANQFFFIFFLRSTKPKNNADIIYRQKRT